VLYILGIGIVNFQDRLAEVASGWFARTPRTHFSPSRNHRPVTVISGGSAKQYNVLGYNLPDDEDTAFNRQVAFWSGLAVGVLGIAMLICGTVLYCAAYRKAKLRAVAIASTEANKDNSESSAADQPR
jgi:hypothetical protein